MTAFVHADEISRRTGLNLATCHDLLLSGWSYNETLHEHTTWVAPIAQLSAGNKEAPVPFGEIHPSHTIRPIQTAKYNTDNCIKCFSCVCHSLKELANPCPDASN